MNLPVIPTERRSRIAQPLLYVVVAVAGIALLVANRADVPVALRALRHARPAFVLVALLLVIVALANQTALHSTAQRATGLESSAVGLIRPVAAAGFFNLVAKSGAMAGLAPLLQASARRQKSRGATVAAYLLVNVLGHLAFAAVLAGSLVVMATDGRFSRVDAVAATLFAITTLAQVALVVAAVRSQSTLRRLYRFASQVSRWATPWKRAHRVPAATSDAAPDTTAADELFDAVQLLRQQPRLAVPSIAHAFGVEIIGVGQLWCILVALGQPPRLVVPVVAYAISVLFTIIGFLPGGLGFVEAGLGAVLVSFGVTGPTAAAAVVLYRVMELWLPFLIGAAAAHSLRMAGPA